MRRRGALTRVARKILDKQKPPGLAGRFFHFRNRLSYSPLPKRRDHHPARRGCVSVVVSAAGWAGGGTGAGAGSAGWLWLTGAGDAGCASTRKLTFSRTVERRRAAALSASCAVSASVAVWGGSGWARSAGCCSDEAAIDETLRLDVEFPQPHSVAAAARQAQDGAGVVRRKRLRPVQKPVLAFVRGKPIDVEHDSQPASDARCVDRAYREAQAAIQAAMDGLASRQRFAIFSSGAQRCRA